MVVAVVAVIVVVIVVIAVCTVIIIQLSSTITYLGRHTGAAAATAAFLSALCTGRVC